MMAPAGSKPPSPMPATWNLGRIEPAAATRRTRSLSARAGRAANLSTGAAPIRRDRALAGRPGRLVLRRQSLRNPPGHRRRPLRCRLPHRTLRLHAAPALHRLRPLLLCQQLRHDVRRTRPVHRRHRIRHGQSVRHADARGALPLFDPHGWNPTLASTARWRRWVGVRTAVAAAARARRRNDCTTRWRMVLPGSVRSRWDTFRHQPGMTGPIQADHYVVALAIEDCCVLMHDPQGFPMPRCRWPISWPPGRRIPWTTARPTPCARLHARLGGLGDRGHPRRAAGRRALARHGSATSRSRRHAGQRRRRRSAGGQAARRLRRRAPDASDPFRGPRRRASRQRRGGCLARAGCPQAAAVAAEQARYIGALQHPLVTRRDASAARCLRRLAPTYSRLLAALRAESWRQSAGDGRGTDTIRPGAVAWAPASTP